MISDFCSKNIQKQCSILLKKKKLLLNVILQNIKIYSQIFFRGVKVTMFQDKMIVANGALSRKSVLCTAGRQAFRIVYLISLDKPYTDNKCSTEAQRNCKLNPTNLIRSHAFSNHI